VTDYRDQVLASGLGELAETMGIEIRQSCEMNEHIDAPLGNQPGNGCT